MSNHHLLQHLGVVLVQHYCQQAVKPRQLTKAFFVRCLIPTIGARWHLDFIQLPGEECFYKTLHYGCCGTAMKEKLAILYFAITDPQCAALMNSVFLAHLKRKSLPHIPYWNRFVEEYNKKKKPRTAKCIALSEVFSILQALPKNDLRKAVEEGKRLMKEKGRK